MAARHNTDQFGRSIVTEQDICDYLYTDPNFNYSQVSIADPSKYNSAIETLYLQLPKLNKLQTLSINPDVWHTNNQKIWFMPEEYVQLDIAKWVLDQCKNEVELQRAGQELLLYSDRDMFDLLKYLKYFVDTLRKNNVVWGVGRGSSVASFVLYLIGVHKINSITYNLDVEEFIR